MEYKANNVKFWIEDSYEELSKKSAEIIKNYINDAPNTVLGLATGSTPLGTYEEFVRLYNANEVDFSGVTTFNLDEYYPIKKSSSQSYGYFMKKYLFNHINIPTERIFIPNGEAIDHVAECAGYEAKMSARGGIDLQLLGIGTNGHIGFNEPNDVFIAPTHYVKLDEDTIKANARFFESEDNVPKHAITMGIRAIMTAKKILMLASGIKKSEIIYQTIFGAISPKNQSSILQLHPNFTIIMDKEAGRLVQDKITLY